MSNVILVKIEGTSREYYPKVDVPLSESDTERMERPFLKDWKETAEEDEYVGMRELSPKDQIGALGVTILQGLATIPGIDKAWLTPTHTQVYLRPGFEWEEVEPQVVHILADALQWETSNVEAYTYTSWLRNVHHKVDAPPIIMKEASRFEDTTMQFWPPCAVADARGFFHSGQTQSHDDDEEHVSIGDKAQLLVEKLFQIEGLYFVEISRYNVQVAVSPAFDQEKAYGQVIEAIVSVYELPEGTPITLKSRDIERHFADLFNLFKREEKVYWNPKGEEKE